MQEIGMTLLSLFFNAVFFADFISDWIKSECLKAR
jgi:hypothetical protein